MDSRISDCLKKQGIVELRPAQTKAIKSGLFEGKNILVCTPTASGKTLVAELAMMQHVFEQKGKVVYIVPLVALANEKFKSFVKKYSFKIGLSVGDYDSVNLDEFDVLICTAEKLDSLLRHRVLWVRGVSLVVVDEVHLLNDVERGPTLEILLTLLRKILPSAQIVALSATIGNPSELADWLGAELVIDNWRPVPLKKGVYLNRKIEFW